jgi:hypothetical protein
VFICADEVFKEPEASPATVAEVTNRKNIDTLRLLRQFTYNRYSLPEDTSLIDIYTKIANRDQNGLIKLTGGGSSGIIEVKLNDITPV